MSAGQFEQNLPVVHAEAIANGDQAAVECLVAIAAMLRSGNLPGVQLAYASLRPIYRERLGPLPTVTTSPRMEPGREPPEPENSAN